MTQFVLVDQFIVDNNPLETGAKAEAMINNRVQEGWKLRGTFCQLSRSSQQTEVQVVHLVYIKES